MCSDLMLTVSKFPNIQLSTRLEESVIAHKVQILKALEDEEDEQPALSAEVRARQLAAHTKRGSLATHL